MDDQKSYVADNSPLGIGGMIAVIADDLTGAAEMAGISLRYGLKVTLCLGKVDVVTTDVVVICTDSRSMRIKGAKNVTQAAVENILQLHPALIFKKVDSVLRGYVMEELKLQLELGGQKRALICPANPSLKRTISDGQYFIEGQLITATGFVNDPEFPVKDAAIKKMLHDDSAKVLKYTAEMPERGIVVGEAVTVDDTDAWATFADDSWLLAGAGDFYNALLQKRYPHKAQAEVEWLTPHLYVCGTAFEERKRFIKDIQQRLGCVAYLPAVIDQAWIAKAIDIIRLQKKLVIAIDGSGADPLYLRAGMAKAVGEIVSAEQVQEIFIEGGATAAAVLQELNCKELLPVNEVQRGVVRMKANDLFITVKPGSYQIPAEIIKLYS